MRIPNNFIIYISYWCRQNSLAVFIFTILFSVIAVRLVKVFFLSSNKERKKRSYPRAKRTRKPKTKNQSTTTLSIPTSEVFVSQSDTINQFVSISTDDDSVFFDAELPPLRCRHRRNYHQRKHY
ncbi:hypothetical protein SNEBB_000493 [Seison nebaliae]|nr:hypothetical protein SNEBB_000493 [Seison nebaliae]